MHYSSGGKSEFCPVARINSAKFTDRRVTSSIIVTEAAGKVQNSIRECDRCRICNRVGPITFRQPIIVLRDSARHPNDSRFTRDPLLLERGRGEIFAGCLAN